MIDYDLNNQDLKDLEFFGVDLNDPDIFGINSKTRTTNRNIVDIDFKKIFNPKK